MNVVRADDLELIFLRQGEQAGNDLPLLADAVILDFDEVVFASKNLHVARAGEVGLGLAPVHEVLANLGGETAGEADQALGVFGQSGQVSARLVIKTLQMGVRYEFEQVLVTGQILG